MKKLIQALQHDHPQLLFCAGDTFHWSPQDKRITYVARAKTDYHHSLLHEVGHALLHHKSFANDSDLLQKELAAWMKAREIAPRYDMAIDQEFVEHCLDSYRDWIFKRSRCPFCNAQGIQQTLFRYRCLNCHQDWKVSDDRLCRPYRRVQ